MTQIKASSAPLILVVDDEALLRMVVKGCFEDAGFDVLEAASGSEALSVLEKRTDISCIFTDVQMPGDPDGLALARTFRDRCP